MFKPALNNQFNSQGFTLLEMTIALGVFIILFTLTLSIYSSTLKAESRSIQISRLQKEAQLIMEVLAKKIRTNKINYSFYTPTEQVDTTNGEDYLALLDAQDNPTVFRFADNSLQVCTESCGTKSAPVADNFNSIPASDIVINNLTFFITPATDPFSNPSQVPQYPKTTVVIDLINTLNGISRNLTIQQTIPQHLAGP